MKKLSKAQFDVLQAIADNNVGMNTYNRFWYQAPYRPIQAKTVRALKTVGMTGGGLYGLHITDAGRKALAAATSEQVTE